MMIYMWQLPDGRWFSSFNPTGRLICTDTASQAHMFSGEELQDLREMWQKYGGKVFHAHLGEMTEVTL